MKTLNRFLAVFILTIISNAMMAQNNKAKVLLLIHSDNGGTYELAKQISKGIEANGNVQGIIKQVKASNHLSLKDIPVASVEELSSFCSSRICKFVERERERERKNASAKHDAYKM